MIGKLIAGGAEGIGNAVSDVVGTIWGSERERESAVHREQMAVLAQFAAEFAGRPPGTWWDSFVDGLNRLPRPLITFGVIGLFTWSAVAPVTFAETMQALQIVPEYLWVMMLTIIAFWFGGRFIKRDLAKPRLSKEQLDLARKIVARREEEARDEAKTKPVSVRPPPSVYRPADDPEPVPPTSADASAPDPAPAGGIDAMIAALIDREGGYVDHPADRGGATKYGITRATLASWVGADVSKADIRALTRDEAARIYRAVYYLGPGIDTLPEGIQEHVFDIAVNSGPRTAVKLLQRTLIRLGAKLAVDGVIGPATRAAVGAHAADDINRTLVDTRLAFYDDIVAGDPRQATFIKGWRARARGFLPRHVAA